MDQGNAVSLGPSMNPVAETASHLHQVVRIQGGVRSGQYSPPGTESATLLAKRKVAVEHDAIDTIIGGLREVPRNTPTSHRVVSSEEPPRTPENPVDPLTAVAPTDSFPSPGVRTAARPELPLSRP